MGKGSILIVEDEGVIAKDIQLTLRRLGYTVLGRASSGAAAIEQTRALQPDLIIMDIVLKGEMDGIEAAEFIRDGFDVPVIFLTAYADDEHLQRAKAAEPFGYIVKPFNERDLRSTIEMALYKHKAEKKLRESETIFRSTFESIPDPATIWEQQPDGRLILTQANKAALEATGGSMGAFIGADLETLYSGEPQILANARKALETGQTVREEIHPTTKYSQGEWFLIDYARIGEGKIIIVAKDITKRKHTEEAFIKRSRALQALHEVLLEIGAEVEMPVVLRRIIEAAMSLLDAEHGIITLYEPATRSLRIVEAVGMAEAHTDDIIPAGDQQENLNKLLEAGQPLIVARWEGCIPKYADADAITMLAVPLLPQDQVAGILWLGADSEKRVFDQDDVWLAEMFATKAAVAVERCRLFQVEREQHALVEALRDTAAAISRTLDLSEVLDRILTNVGRVVPHDAASILFIEGSAARVVRCRGFAERGLDKDVHNLRFRIHDTPTLRRMVATRQPSIIPDTRNSPDWIDIPEIRWARAYLGTPICWEDQAIGFLTLDSATPGAFTPAHAEQLRAFTDQAAVAIQNARLYRELQTYSANLERMVERRTAELRRIKDRTEIILNGSPDAILLLWPDGTVQMANQAFCDVFGYAHSDEVFGKPLNTLVEASKTEARESTLQEVVRQKRAGRVTFTACRKDRSTFDAEAAIAPVIEGNRVVGLVCSIHDVSAFKEMERMKDAFIQNVSHQFRTPVTTLQLYTQLLLKQPSKAGQYLQVLNDQANRLVSLVQDILEITALTSAAIAGRPVALADVIESVALEYGDRARAAGLTLSTTTPGASLTVQGDFDRLAQALGELTENAITFTPAGGQVTLSLDTQTEDGKPWAVLVVRDTGPGIPPGERERVFERFYRGGIAGSGHIPGTGLGLAIAQAIVERHRGHLDLVSPGEAGGATFRIWLPAAGETAPPAV
ncbi:MAG: GAF domain-containing protein [Anaerolineae bacterium]|nr:GAF domain-containing protein [Anaerolineae bacterium]